MTQSVATLVPTVDTLELGTGTLVIDAEARVSHADSQALRLLGSSLRAGDGLSGNLASAVTETAVRGQTDFLADSGRLVTLQAVPLPAGMTLFKVEDRDARETLGTRLLQRERLSNLGALAAGMGHEVATPLACALMDLECLKESLGEVTEEVEGLQDALGRIREIVDRLRAFSRMDVSIRAVRCDRAIRTTLGMVRSSLRRVRVREEMEGACEVLADEGQLVQVLVNLVCNAGHALEGQSDGRIVVSARTRGRSVRITVSDNGPGVPEHLRDRLFEPFVTGRPGSGTGLGLALSKQLIELQGGCLNHAPNPLGGATFSIDLPAAPRLRRLLVVDDDHQLRAALVRLLDAYDCVEAEDVPSAIALLQTQSVDAVITDLDMPGPSGTELLRWLAQHRPRLLATTLMLSGSNPPSGAEELLARTGGFVRKPADLRELARRLDEGAGTERRYGERRHGRDLLLQADGRSMQVLDAGPDTLRVRDTAGTLQGENATLKLAGQLLPVSLSVLRRGEGEAVVRVDGPCSSKRLMMAWFDGTEANRPSDIGR